MRQTTIRSSWAALRRDYRALAAYHGEGGHPGGFALALSPSLWCVALYRVSRYFYTRRLRLVARLFWQVNYHMTGADINPIADIGPGFVVINPVAITIAGKAGANLLVVGMGGFGGGLKMDDVGAGPGFACLGDNVRLHMGAVILGAQRIGHNAVIGPNCTVMYDVPENTEVWPVPPRVRPASRHLGAPSP